LNQGRNFCPLDFSDYSFLHSYFWFSLVAEDLLCQTMEMPAMGLMAISKVMSHQNTVVNLMVTHARLDVRR